jgi:hypothetical protein
MITVSSTIGFEAIQRGLPLVAFGRGAWSHKGLVFEVDTPNKIKHICDGSYLEEITPDTHEYFMDWITSTPQQYIRKKDFEFTNATPAATKFIKILDKKAKFPYTEIVKRLDRHNGSSRCPRIIIRAEDGRNRTSNLLNYCINNNIRFSAYWLGGPRHMMKHPYGQLYCLLQGMRENAFRDVVYCERDRELKKYKNITNSDKSNVFILHKDGHLVYAKFSSNIETEWRLLNCMRALQQNPDTPLSAFLDTNGKI